MLTTLFAATIVGPPVLYRLESFQLPLMRQDWGSARAGRSVEGNPLKIRGTTYTHGVGTHANSDFTIRLNGEADRFNAIVGVDDEALQGSVVFEVWGDNKPLFNSGIMRGTTPAKKIEVSLKGVKMLRLSVTDGDNGIDYDHADWAEAEIWVNDNAKSKPIAVPEAGNADLLAAPIKLAVGTPEKPWIHGPRVVGTTPGRPFIFRVPTTGLRPISFKVVKGSLPAGLSLNDKGVIDGRTSATVTTKFTVEARNAKGADRREYTIVAGKHKLALTPPMGWNSWNVWGTDVDAAKVKAAADMFVKTGLADYGYTYVNIDDAWEGDRDANGEIQTNKKFPDMRALSDSIHAHGLKMGIYSSPGPRTCAGYVGSYQHELQDAQTWAKWGVDYIKHDWCSYGEIKPRPTLAEFQHPYQVMREALDKVDRDIVYSLCQYGMGDVFKWGKSAVGGNLWRTTGDITDTWASMAGIGFIHSEKASGVTPGGWNDPDMLVVGKLGWGGNPRPNRLTSNEQITHITLWSMLAAPLLIGCDLTQIDPFTKALLMNHDVIEIDQDPLGIPATRKWQKANQEIWTRPLWDGTTAVAVFNRARTKATINVNLEALKLKKDSVVRDVWQMKSIGRKATDFNTNVPAHGAMLFKVG